MSVPKTSRESRRSLYNKIKKALKQPCFVQEVIPPERIYTKIELDSYDFHNRFGFTWRYAWRTKHGDRAFAVHSRLEIEKLCQLFSAPDLKVSGWDEVLDTPLWIAGCPVFVRDSVEPDTLVCFTREPSWIRI